MTRFLAFGGVRFVLAGVLAFALAACFVGRAEAASVFSSSFAAPSVFADSAAPGARVVAGDRALTVFWGSVKGAAAYRVSWRGRILKGGKPTAAWSKKWLGLKVLKASARSYKATRLVNGSEYQLRLESKAKTKKSRWVARSTPVASPKAVAPTPTPTPATVPGAPTSVSGVAGDGQVVVSWLAPSSDGGSAVTAYTVTASNGGSRTCTTATLSCTVTGLTNATAYTFTVVATNARGTSVASVASAAATPATVPGAPTSVSGVAGDASVVVSWLAPSSDGGSAVTGYTVTASGGGSQTCTTSGALSCTVTGLTNGTPYTFAVKATNARGNSVASRASDAFTAGSWVVGDTGPGGGKVFYASAGTFTETGAACGSSCRYLEAAPVGWHSGGSPDPSLVWGVRGEGNPGECSNKDISGADGTAIGSGEANTAAIMAGCPAASGTNSAPAARAAACYQVTGTCGPENYGQWFLPSKDELNLLDVSFVGVDPGVYYWSSSQDSASSAWGQYVGLGGGSFQFIGIKGNAYHVRAIRAF